MLSEPECRVLSSAFDTLAKDFDPKDATVFLEGSGLITTDLAEKIETRPTRLERLREFLRIYRRRATDCELLISYFKFAGQEYIANLLQTDLEHALDSNERCSSVPRFPHHLRLRKLLAGHVPRVWQHVKREHLQNNVAEVLRQRADLGSVLRTFALFLFFSNYTSKHLFRIGDMASRFSFWTRPCPYVVSGSSSYVMG
ncbi:unnamed protein product [Haemonchus placei]|uniref:CARD domain-containing protein n=1 Tax=Haemonchus placei TaxID=6290 RepID=A0A0N4WSR5_HAEPC|nr:unnamed protein product [Haemonchus placei]